MKSLIRVKTPEYDEPLLDRIRDWRRCYELPVTEVHVPMEKVVQALADLAGLRFTEAADDGRAGEVHDRGVESMKLWNWDTHKPPCRDPSHNPPSMLYIPRGQSHVHRCPSCGVEYIMHGYGATLCCTQYT